MSVAEPSTGQPHDHPFGLTTRLARMMPLEELARTETPNIGLDFMQQAALNVIKSLCAAHQGRDEWGTTLYDADVATDEWLGTDDVESLSPRQRAVLACLLLEVNAAAFGVGRVHPNVRTVLHALVPALKKLEPAALIVIRAALLKLLESPHTDPKHEDDIWLAVTAMLTLGELAEDRSLLTPAKFSFDRPTEGFWFSEYSFAACKAFAAAARSIKPFSQALADRWALLLDAPPSEQ